MLRAEPELGLDQPELEALEARLLLHSSPVLDAEHLAVFGARDVTTGVITGGLVPDSSLTYISVPGTAPEKWSDASTWRYVGPALAAGIVPSPIPGPGANVTRTPSASSFR